MTGARPRPVGILGGMGPDATILMMRRVLARVDAHDDADHVPLIVHSNTQVPSRIARLIDGTGADPEPVLVAMAQDLARCGAEALAMPCNTAHAYASAIAAATPLPFLDMVALSVGAAAQRAAGERIGLLASPATRRAGVFDGALAERGLAPVWAEDEAAVLGAIRALKRDAGDADAARAASAAVEALAAGGSGAILIACTEFSLIAHTLAAPVPLLDTLDVLADAVVAFSRTP